MSRIYSSRICHFPFVFIHIVGSTFIFDISSIGVCTLPSLELRVGDLQKRPYLKFSSMDVTPDCRPSNPDAGRFPCAFGELNGLELIVAGNVRVVMTGPHNNSSIAYQSTL